MTISPLSFGHDTPIFSNQASVLPPALWLIPALCAFSVIPFGPTIEIFGKPVSLVIVDLDAGVLFALAASSLGVYGIVLAGWSSRSKYSLMGGLRSSAQMISYELPLALSVVAAVLVSGTLRPAAIVEQKAGWLWNWNVFGGGWSSSGSSSSSSPASRRRIGSPSTSRRPRPSSSPGTTPSTLR